MRINNENAEIDIDREKHVIRNTIKKNVDMQGKEQLQARLKMTKLRRTNMARQKMI